MASLTEVGGPGRAEQLNWALLESSSQALVDRGRGALSIKVNFKRREVKQIKTKKKLR